MGGPLLALRKRMTRRRYVAAGRTTGNSRRTTRRYHLFTPDEAGEMEQIFWYCLGVAAHRHGISIHAACLMSTHPHYSARDNRGTLPDFRRDFHRWLAMATKRFRGWDEEVFNKSPAGEHELLTPEAVVRDIAYTIVNPPAAGAVRYAKDWPGATTRVRDIGRRVIRVRRPKYWFDPKNPNWPDVVELKLEMPAILIEAYGSVEEAQRVIAAEVRRLEHEARRALEAEGRTFSGARRVLRTPHTKQAETRLERSSRNPRFAAGGDRQALAAAVKRFRQFDADYAEALERWRSGDRNVLFPHGTWWMRIHHRIRCHPPP